MTAANGSKAARLWLSQRAATAVLNISPKKLGELVADGHVRVRAIPGTWVKYLGEDIFRLAEPANVTGQPA